jgi:hypothetical protein
MGKNNQKTKKEITVEGMMTYGQNENGMHILDFACLEDVMMEKISANFKVQLMRDGNVYMEEIPKRERNTPIFRDDNSSLSLGKNDRYYFTFSLPKERVYELAAELVRQASTIAQKVRDNIDFDK